MGYFCNIKNNKFDINPKVINGVNKGCEFCKFKDICFMTENDIEKIQVDDGCGKKGKIAKNANGEFKVSITSNDTL